MIHYPITRRRFVQGSAAVAAAGVVGFPAIVPSRAFGANERLNIAGIGAGGKGEVDVSACGSQNIVALCDVDERNAGNMFSQFPKATRYKDYRVMLEKEGKNIDAVTVSTPDHIHAPAAMMAMRMGKHVYVQKPLTHTVQEARAMTEMAREKKLATQMGNQGHSEIATRRLVEVIKAGGLGKVSRVHVWTDRPIWPQGVSRPAEEPAPPTLDWDLWLGPAPVRPYSRAYAPFNWRGFWDFGTGALGDMGCHCMDLPFFALDLQHASAVSPQSAGGNEESAPNWSIIDYEFPATANHPAIKMTWYDGGKTPPKELIKDHKWENNGVIIEGDKDTLYVPGYWGPGHFLSGAKIEDFKDVPETIEKRPGSFEANHHNEWIEACKGGKPAMSNFDYSGPMTETVLLGNVALRVGQRIEWDAKAMKVTNISEANRYLSKEYRKGWEL